MTYFVDENWIRDKASVHKSDDEGTEKLHSLLNSGAVTMTKIDRDRDVYGRMLRNVAVNGQDVGEAMISPAWHGNMEVGG